MSKVQIVYSVDGADGLTMHMQLIKRRMKEISKKKRERNWSRATAQNWREKSAKLLPRGHYCNEQRGKMPSDVTSTAALAGTGELFLGPTVLNLSPRTRES